MSRIFNFTMAFMLLFSFAASADTIVITYRSGKVQTIAMDEGVAEVKDVGFRKSNDSNAQDIKSGISVSDSAKGDAKPQADTAKQGIKIRWAPPIEE